MAPLGWGSGPERFVWWLLAGGLALVGGLWLTALFPRGAAPWLAGVLAAAAGVVGLGWSIRSQLAV